MIRMLMVAFLLTASVQAADFEILERSSTMTVVSNAFITEHHREVVRILTERGMDYRKYLAVNSYIQIRNVSVSVHQPDGRVERMKDEEIIEMPVSQSVSMISDLKMLVIAPPSLVKGSTATIEYDRAATSLLYIQPCTYATTAPIRKTSCILTHPQEIPIKYTGQDDSVVIQDSMEGSARTLRFESGARKAITILGDDVTSSEVEKRVDFVPQKCMIEKWQLSTESWKDVAAWFADLSRFAYQWDPSMDSVVAEAKAQNASPEQIAENLYEYIQKTFVYTAVEIGIGGYKPRFTNQTFLKKYGDCKDLSFLYVFLLNKAGVEAYPALVDTRSAQSFRKDFPTPTQFNHCIAYLPGIRSGTWVDSTVKNFRLGEVPSVIQGHEALVIGPNELMEIPRNLRDANVLNLSFAGRFAEPTLSWSGKIEASGLNSMLVDIMRNALVENNARTYLYESVLQMDAPVSRVETQIQDDRTLSIEYTTPVQPAERYRVVYLNPVNYAALDLLPFRPQPDEYYATGHPVRLIARYSLDLAGKRLVSESYRRQYTGEHIEYELLLAVQEGRLTYMADILFSNGLLTGADMKKYQQELNKLQADLQRTIVLE